METGSCREQVLKMAKKILYCASTVSHLLNFHLPYLRAFHEMGYEVWAAADRHASVPYADHVVALPMRKKFLAPGNARAVLEARSLIRKEGFDIVSTHTGLASAVVRAGILLLRKRPKVVCTVHGYLFHETDGLKKWLYLFPEKLCARVTDVLMVMNHEDYEVAQKHRLYGDRLCFVGGMGIDLAKFGPATPGERASARKKLGIREDDFVFVYAAEFSKRKNQAFLISAFAEASKNHPRMKLLLAGTGALLESSKELVRQSGAEERIRFLGFVADMRELYAACDVCVSVSLIEGLPFNVMEAMACGLPVLASDIKGHRELVGKGMLFPQDDAESLEKRLETVFSQHGTGRASRSRTAPAPDLSRWDIRTVLPQIIGIYQSIAPDRM